MGTPNTTSVDEFINAHHRSLSLWYTIKHSWKKKKRFLSIDPINLTTHDCSTWENTNQWAWENGIADVSPSEKYPEQVVIITKKDGKKKDTLNFESDHRSDLLTDLQRSLSVVRAAEKQGKTIDQINYRHLGRTGYVYEMSLRELMTGMYKSYSAKKLKRNGTWLDLKLTVCSCSIEETDMDANLVQSSGNGNSQLKIRVSYFFKDFIKIESLADNPNALLFYFAGNSITNSATDQPTPIASDLFIVNDPKFVENIVIYSKKYVGHEIKFQKSTTTLQEYPTSHRYKRHGKDDDETLVSIIDFNVSKISNRHSTPISRLLTLSTTKIVERDLANYSIVTTRPYSTIACFVRYDSDSQRLSIQYKDGLLRTYSSSSRDALIASALDFCRSVGNTNATVFTSQIVRGMKITPHHVIPNEDVQESYIKLFENKSFDFENLSVSQITLSLDGFISNIPYAGLSNSFSEKNGKVVLNAIQKILSGLKISNLGSSLPSSTSLTTPSSSSNSGSNVDDKSDLELISVVLQMLRRVVATRVGFELFTHFPQCKIPLINLLRRSIQCVDDTIAYYALDLLIALIQPAFEGDFELAQCQTNKRELFLSIDLNKTIFEIIQKHSSAGTGSLVLSSAVELLTLLLCEPYSETTDSTIFNDMLSRVGKLGKDLFKLFTHQCPAISKNAGMLMSVVINEGEEELAKQMQIISVVEGSLLRHLHDSLFLKINSNQNNPTNIRNQSKREMSKQLISLWTAENKVCRHLLDRVFPRGLVQFLDSQEEAPKESLIEGNVKHEHQGNKQIKLGVFANWRMKKILKTRELMAKATSRVRKEVKPMKPYNWSMFFYQFNQDHRDANLIWNHTTREELRESMDNEIRLFQQELEAAGREVIAWNDEDFEVAYPSLKKEISVGGYYISLLVDGTSKGIKLVNPGLFFSELWQNFLLNESPDQKALCLRAMTLVFTYYHGHPSMTHPFSNLSHLIELLENTMDVILRDRLLLFVRSLLQVKSNAKLFIDNRGIYRLLDLITLIHTHYTYGEEGKFLPEWYYAVDVQQEGSTVIQQQKAGPVSRTDLFELLNNKKINKNTKCWAQGTEKWKPLYQIPELRWTIMNGTTHGNVGGVLPKAELGSVILDILNALCSFRPTRHPVTNAVIRPLPRVKRIICEPLNLPRIVQVLLSGQDILVEKTATLLASLLVDNSIVTSKFYLTGAFFFMMLYPNSNVLPIVQLLQIIHNKQHLITSDESLSRRSILTPLLPEALVCYLENYTPENFSAKFLSDNDDPETIWNSSMRKVMREKIELHLASLPQRLHSNTTTIYEYVPIPKIVFEELEGELFCHSFYLSRLCNTRKFPNWPIKQPLELFKSVLLVWSEEAVKVPQTMSVDDALEVLNLKPNKGASGKAHNYKDDDIRKAYYKLAVKYHPDRNPDGREMFEKIQEAYELLSTVNNIDNERGSDKKISLLLLTQVILYTRFMDLFRPFKYPAYSQLWKLINELLVNGDKSFDNTNKTPLISPAMALLYLTVEASPLNSEEITRNNGVPIISKCFDKAVSLTFQSIDVSTLIIQTTPISPSFAGKQHKGDLPDPNKDGTPGTASSSENNAPPDLDGEAAKPKFNPTATSSPTTGNALITIRSSKFNINDHQDGGSDIPGEVIGSILRTYAVMAKFPGSRKQLEANNLSLKICENICKCLYLSYSHPHIVTYALEAIYQFARQDDELQQSIINAGVMWHLLRLLYGYDHTLFNSGISVNLDSNRIMISNIHAKMSLKSIRRFSGIKSEEDMEGYVEPSDKPNEPQKKPAAPVVQVPKGPIAVPIPELNNQLQIAGSTPTPSPPTPAPAPAVDPLGGSSTSSSQSTPNQSPLSQPQNTTTNNNGPNNQISTQQKINTSNIGNNTPATQTPPTQAPANVSAAQAQKEAAAKQKYEKELKEYMEKPETEFNLMVKEMVTVYLTPHIILRLKMPIGTHPSKHYHKLLTEMNTKHETAAFIWNNSTREDLMEYLNKRLDDANRNPTSIHPFSTDSFTYKSLSNELKVGGYYLRVYNANPSAPTNATTPVQELFVHLVEFLAKERTINECPIRNPDKKLWDIYIFKVSQVLESLRNVVQFGKVTPVLYNLAGSNRMRLLFSFLLHHDNQKIQKLALESLMLLTSNIECINHISQLASEPEGSLLPYLMQLLARPNPNTLELALKVEHSLVAVSQHVIDTINHCGLLYLLDVFSNNQVTMENRIKAVGVLGRMIIDKVHGPRVTLLISKFIPPVFNSTMSEDPQQTVMVFDAQHENPELIWNNNTRAQLKEALTTLEKEYQSKLVQAKTYNVQWKLPSEDYQVQYSINGGEDELIIGGVYISLFLKQPGWSLRNPRKFLLEVFDLLLKLASTSEVNSALDPKIQPLSLAIISLFQHHNVISDQLPSTGYIEKILPLLGHSVPQIRSLMINILHSMSESQVCVDHLAKVGIVWTHLSRAISLPNDNLPLTAECICKILNLNRCEKTCLVEQACRSDFINQSLNLLERGKGVSPSTQALVVNYLKKLESDMIHGQSITMILDKSEIWASYSSQSHDLFITGPAANTAGLLTGNTSSTSVGLLTSTAFNSTTMGKNDEPPPLL